MKSILVDAYKTIDLNSGLGQFSLQYARELLKQNPAGVDITYLLPGSVSSRLISPSQINTINSDLQKRYLPFLNPKYTIWHSLYQLPSHFPRKGTFWILTIHDLNFLSEKNSKKANKYLRKIQQNIDRADCITTISNFSKGVIEEHVNLKGKEIHVIYNGIASNEYDEQSIAPGYIGEDKFLFSIGIFNRKKNFHTLLPLMKSLTNHKLVLAGNHDTSYGREIIQEIKRLNLEDRVILPGKISEPEKSWLYNNCDALLFPSLAEGFGMPVIEAMKAGKPVFLSKYTSLPEIGGDAAFYFDSFDESHMVEVIKSGLDTFNINPEHHTAIIKKHAEKFSWETSIRNYVELYQRVI